MEAITQLQRSQPLEAAEFPFPRIVPSTEDPTLHSEKSSSCSSSSSSSSKLDLASILQMGDDFSFLQALYSGPSSPPSTNETRPRLLPTPPTAFSTPSPPSPTPPGRSNQTPPEPNTDHDTPVAPGATDLTRLKRNIKRQAQNREAQRRFRDRREQERLQLITLLESLQTETRRLASLLEQSQGKYAALEERHKRTAAEAEILRRWQQKVLSCMGDLVDVEEGDEEMGMDMGLGMGMGASCSWECWRRGVVKSKAVIVMQTLAGLFRRVEGEGVVELAGEIGV
ncbi:hypothetical protein BJY04DRAFT_192564 [Aspergillus karnatakaensis]|uniref:bZIP transcription factor n=1 Tax=Aspergillus karnatakaensis TaxID=1810916 RepID=UPI003CCDBC36